MCRCHFGRIRNYQRSAYSLSAFFTEKTLKIITPPQRKARMIFNTLPKPDLRIFFGPNRPKPVTTRSTTGISQKKFFFPSQHSSTQLHLHFLLILSPPSLIPPDGHKTVGQTQIYYTSKRMKNRVFSYFFWLKKEVFLPLRHHKPPKSPYPPRSYTAHWPQYAPQPAPDHGFPLCRSTVPQRS